MWGRAVGSHAVDDDVDRVGAGVRAPVRHGDLARLSSAPDVEGQGVIGLAKALPDPVIHHRLGAKAPLFGRLSDQHEGA